MTAKEADAATIPLAWFSKAIGRAQDTVRQQLAELGFTYSGGKGVSAGIPLALAFQVIRGTEQEKELSPSDQRNLAQAEKARAETAIIEGKWRPLEEMRGFLSEFGQFISKTLKESDLPEKEKRRIFERLETGAAQFHE